MISLRKTSDRIPAPRMSWPRKITMGVVGFVALLAVAGIISGPKKTDPTPAAAAPTTEAPRPAPVTKETPPPFSVPELVEDAEPGKAKTMRIAEYLAVWNNGRAGEKDIEVTGAKNGRHGTVTVTGPGTVRYAAAASFKGETEDRFTYTLTYRGKAYTGTVVVYESAGEVDMDWGSGSGGHDDRQCVGRKRLKVCG